MDWELLSLWFNNCIVELAPDEAGNTWQDAQNYIVAFMIFCLDERRMSDFECVPSHPTTWSGPVLPCHCLPSWWRLFNRKWGSPSLRWRLLFIQRSRDNSDPELSSWWVFYIFCAICIAKSTCLIRKRLVHIINNGIDMKLSLLHTFMTSAWQRDTDDAQLLLVVSPNLPLWQEIGSAIKKKSCVLCVYFIKHNPPHPCFLLQTYASWSLHQLIVRISSVNWHL